MGDEIQFNGVMEYNGRNGEGNGVLIDQYDEWWMMGKFNGGDK